MCFETIYPIFKWHSVINFLYIKSQCSLSLNNRQEKQNGTFIINCMRVCIYIYLWTESHIKVKCWPKIVCPFFFIWGLNLAKVLISADCQPVYLLILLSPLTLKLQLYGSNACIWMKTMIKKIKNQPVFNNDIKAKLNH